MRQNAFKEVLQKYLNGSSTPGEKQLVEEWFEAVGKEYDHHLTEDEERELLNCYEKDLRKIYLAKEEKTLPFLLHHSGWIKAAAVLFLVVSAVLYLYVHNVAEASKGLAATAPAPEQKKIVNTQESAITVVLSEQSEVVLNPGGALTFNTDFEVGHREVSLTGEAFFNVTRDSLRPFIVKTGELTTRVLGTSFTIKANLSDDNVTVTVKTGKVSLQRVSSEAAKTMTEEIVTPNQQAVYNIKDRTFMKKELEVRGAIAKQGYPHRYRFHEAPVREILQVLEATHRTEISFDKKAFTGCLLSTSITANENIFKRLDIICKAIGATYRVDGVSIHVTGRSCDPASK